MIQVEWQMQKVEEQAGVAQIESYSWIYYEIREAEDMIIEHNGNNLIEYLSTVMR